MVNKKADKIKSNLTTTQQVLYSHEFKHADRAAGFSEKKSRLRDAELSWSAQTK